MNKKLVVLTGLVGFAAVAAAFAPSSYSAGGGSSGGGSGMHGGGRSVAEHRPLNAAAALSVRNTAGSIRVEAWDKSEIDLTGQLSDNVERLEFSGDANDLHIDVRLKKGDHSSYADTRLLLKVPRDVVLTLEGTSADLFVNGLRGKLTARTVSGDVDLKVDSSELVAQSVSGDVSVDAPKATLTTVTTVSGETELRGPSGVLRAESVSGDINLSGGTFTALDLKSVSGDVEVRAATAADAAVKAESLSGDVRFNATGLLNAKVSLKSFSGDKHCNISDAAEPVADGRRNRYTVGNGKGQISLTSFSGNVVLDGQDK